MSSSCNKNATQITKSTGKDETRWNPYCTCDECKCPGIKKLETGIHKFKLSEGGGVLNGEY